MPENQPNVIIPSGVPLGIDTFETPIMEDPGPKLAPNWTTVVAIAVGVFLFAKFTKVI